MLFWLAFIFSKSRVAIKNKRLIFTPILFCIASSAWSQTTQGVNREQSANAITCYKSSIKDPVSFFGNPMDIFTLYDGSKWKVSGGGAHVYTPLRYRNVLICPSEELLVVDKKAISVSKIN